ncbi:MAG: flagellar hook-basal body complex protein FliE [Buchnera aphidicola (Tetraneura akinire)]|nr:flagellar hook-basal body complex protein FliE [Buchnera sp. (in: enterobacteria)]
MFIEGLKMIENANPNFNKFSTLSNKFSSEFKKNILSSKNENNFSDQKIFLNKINDVSLPKIMIDLQKSSLSLQLAAKISNKLVSAYHEIMNMPV